MQLPFIKKNEPQKNFFVSLIIAPYRVGAILFEEINSKLFILSSREEEVGKNANDLSAEELLTAADHVISFVETSLPEGGNLDKTIFSVPHDWIIDGKIAQEHLVKLKRICQDLGLTPVGYLISVEAIISYLTNQEGAPVSAIFVEIANKQIIVYLVRAGKILEVHSGEVEENVLATTESLLKKIVKVDVLPSKILLLDYKDGAESQQEFVYHTWPKDIPFLHVPQVTVLEKGIENEATINGVAQQMELEVLQDAPKSELAREEIAEESALPIFKEEKPDEKVEEKIEEAAPEEFGFMK